jgi:alpha-tubulin suppressor-like RCC1 family protein
LLFKPLTAFHIFRKQISVPVRVQGLERVRLIAVGAFHNLALQEDGTLWAWGNNEYGQLGTGDTQPRSQPILVQGLSGLNLVCITSLSPFLLDFYFYSISLGIVSCTIQFLISSEVLGFIDEWVPHSSLFLKILLPRLPE